MAPCNNAGVTISILGICGSLRQASLNRALLRELAAVMPEGATLSLYDGAGVGIGDLPLFSSDIAQDPTPVAELARAVNAADAVVFATPEYNFSIPGALKNAIDWMSRGPAAPLKKKPVGMIGSSVGMSGSLRAQAHLRQILLYFDAPTLAQPEVLVVRAHEKFDAAGNLTDEATRAHLRLFGATFVKFVSHQQALP